MLIDKYVPDFQFREKHSLTVNATANTVLSSAMAYQPEHDPVFQVAITVRELHTSLMARLTGRTPSPPFSMKNFTLLEHRDAQEAVFGLMGQFWKSDYGQIPLKTPEDFLTLNTPGCARLALNFAVHPLRNGQTLLSTETRVFCPDMESRRKFTPYWFLIRPVSGLIRKRALTSISQHARSISPKNTHTP